LGSNATTHGRTDIPTSGRIGRLARAIEKDAGREVLLKVMEGVDQYLSTSSYTEKAAWMRDAIERLERLVGVEGSRRIMESCGQKCCGLTSRKIAKKLMSETESIADFVQKLNDAGLGGGRLQLVDKHTITGGYDHCYCGHVKKTDQPFSSTTYCHCSVGWYKQLFESALGRPVDVEIKRSIISGANRCDFIIHI
jgi:predicted ArsR family transcriptional regulator